MRNAIKEYIELNDAEKNNLWSSATFIFDTNIFLNLYRYSNKTRNQLINAFELLKARVWMPYQVAWEFCKDRYSIIDEANKRFDIIVSEADKLIVNWKTALRLDSSDSDIEELSKYLKEWVAKKKENNYLTINATEDEIFGKLLDLFDGKVGKAFGESEKKAIEQEGEIRYASKVPPGYKDNSKTENRFGDLFAWKEIINYANSNKLDIIFVTDDRKEDWWNISNGKTIGPRIELRREFYKETGKTFHMYTLSSFLSHFAQSNDEPIDKTTIEEVNLFDSVMSKNISFSQINEYYESFKNDSEREAAQIRFEIAVLQRKNEKRVKSINDLTQKSKRRKLSTNEEIALKSNSENFNRDFIKIGELNKRLMRLLP
ncbi:MAG: DUF4935 domain-containing protein [Oscillospiraceae bacterium]|nr:DUF4935 domain-containing protein [Oscillospiraceae bacterium]